MREYLLTTGQGNGTDDRSGSLSHLASLVPEGEIVQDTAKHTRFDASKKETADQKTSIACAGSHAHNNGTPGAHNGGNPSGRTNPKMNSQYS